MKRVLKWVGIVLGVVVVSLLCIYGWASWRASDMLSATYEAHDVSFPVPFPLTDDELEALREERRVPPAEVAEGAAVSFAVTGADPDGDAVVLALIAAPAREETPYIEHDFIAHGLQARLAIANEEG